MRTEQEISEKLTEYRIAHNKKQILKTWLKDDGRGGKVLMIKHIPSGEEVGVWFGALPSPSLDDALTIVQNAIVTLQVCMEFPADAALGQ